MSTVWSLYNISHYNSDFNRTWLYWGSQFFYHGILQKNYRKMTIKWSFSYNSFVELSFFDTIYFNNTALSHGAQTVFYIPPTAWVI